MVCRACTAQQLSLNLFELTARTIVIIIILFCNSQRHHAAKQIRTCIFNKSPSALGRLFPDGEYHTYYIIIIIIVLTLEILCGERNGGKKNCVPTIVYHIIIIIYYIIFLHTTTMLYNDMHINYYVTENPATRPIAYLYTARVQHNII